MTIKPLEDNRVAMQHAWVERRRLGAVLMSVIALASLLRLRVGCEAFWSWGAESLLQAMLLTAWCSLSVRGRTADRQQVQQNDAKYLVLFAVALVLLPWCWQLVTRMFDEGTGLELVGLSSFAWATLLSACAAQRRQALGTVVICSGFCTLVATCSSDHASALIVAMLWGGTCLWWLAAAHWQQVRQCHASTVIENRWQLPMTVVASGLVFSVAAWSVAGRFPQAQRLPWDVSPTSGGTSSNDEFARSGVGDGDALVAARENAASFGAVDSDLMLDSKEASLFDLYSDTFGEPVRKQDFEQTVALSQQLMETAAPTNETQSDGASSTLTTQRRSGQAPREQSNRVSDALLFWIGRPNSHLALERFSSFDGVAWHLATNEQSAGSASPDRLLESTSSGNRTWFKANTGNHAVGTGGVDNHSSVFTGSMPEAIKIARLKSPRIPTMAGMHSWHIHQVDDGSFFRMDADDNLSMPRRKSVPEFTIVRFVNREIDLESLMRTTSGIMRKDVSSSTAGQRLESATALARSWLPANVAVADWNTVSVVIKNLQQQFRFDRTIDTSEMADPLANFMEGRAGNDLMFATAAAVMLRELGFQTRLVTGLLAKAENRLGWTREYAVYGHDTHAWLEIKTTGGDWIPLEPTPGYPQPEYRVSWRCWLALNAWSLAASAGACVCLCGLAYWQSAWLFDCLCRIFLVVGLCASDRQKCRWLLSILDCRSRLVGYRRPVHVSPKQWYSALNSVGAPHVPAEVAQSISIFFREADRVWFGHDAALSSAGRSACQTLWTQSSCRMLKEALRAPAGSVPQPRRFANVN